jgi:proteasome assembly chaperone (PAC2) family protein
MEPHQKWRTYTKVLLDVAAHCGVTRIVSLGALLAGAPHTRPTRVTGRCTDPAWRALLEAWGIYRQPSYEGPTGISTVVLDAATRRGMSHLGFMGQAPLSAGPNPGDQHRSPMSPAFSTLTWICPDRWAILDFT